MRCAQIALEVLGAQGVGAFLVRASTTQRGCLALSLRVPRDFAHHGIAHYLILRTPKGYKIKVPIIQILTCLIKFHLMCEVKFFYKYSYYQRVHTSQSLDVGD